MKGLLSRGKGPRVELLCVGTELLMGKLNTHGAYFSALLEDLGCPLARETTVSDDPAEMEAAFRDAWRRASVVLVTGGLGPTFDDVTRDVWANVTGARLRFQPDLLKGIQERFRKRGLAMPPANRRQACLLTGARALVNENGTAPGQLLERRGRLLVLLPGPRRELVPMVERHLVPLIKSRFALGDRRTRIWRLFGRGESAVDQRLRALARSPGRGLRATWGILAQAGVVDVKLTLSGPKAERVESAFFQWDGRLRKEFGADLFGEGTDTLEQVVGRRLAERNETLAVAESCTGGLLAERVTQVPGSSRYFWGGVVVYDNRAKETLLGVRRSLLTKHGAVSAPVARAMAVGLRRRSKTAHALSITGVAGPDGGTPKKPVGLVYVGWASRGRSRVWRLFILGGREIVRQQAALRALDFLRRRLGVKGVR